MQRHVLMTLRTAAKEDFSTIHGERKTGILYFEQNHAGAIQKSPKYFTASTDMQSFKELYANGQIFVPKGLFDDVAVLEEEELVTN